MAFDWLTDLTLHRIQLHCSDHAICLQSTSNSIPFMSPVQYQTCSVHHKLVQHCRTSSLSTHRSHNVKNPSSIIQENVSSNLLLKISDCYSSMQFSNKWKVNLSVSERHPCRKCENEAENSNVSQNRNSAVGLNQQSTKNYHFLYNNFCSYCQNCPI